MKSRGWGLMLTALAVVLATLFLGTVTKVVVDRTYTERSNYQEMRNSPPAASGDERMRGSACDLLEDHTEIVSCARAEAITDLRTQRESLDLRAQQDMAAFSHGLFLFAALSFWIGGLGVAALVWTFVEQRKLTQNESRAYVKVGEGSLHLDPTYGLLYRVRIKNYGKTPAVQISGALEFFMDVQSPDDRTKTRETREAVGLQLDELPGETAAVLDADRLYDILSIPRSLSASGGSHYERTGGLIGTGDPDEDGVEEVIGVRGKLQYRDVFGGRHSIRIDQYSHSLESDGWSLRGTGRGELIGPEDR